MIKEFYKNKKTLAKKIITRVLQGILVFHFGTQTAYLAHDAIKYISPSKERTTFRKELGFQNLGYEQEIEQDKHNFQTIAAVIQKERLEKPFELSSIRIRSNSYLKKSFTQQLDSLIGADPVGYYFLNSITLDHHVLEDTVHHEIKHAKAAALEKQHPEFKEQWIQLAQDAQGESMYLSFKARLCAALKICSFFMGTPTFQHNEHDGFVSDYARTNINEDIAELCARAELDEESFIPWLYELPRQRIIAKVALAEHYQLIPPHFSQYILLQKRLKDSLRTNGNDSRFLSESEDFLKKHPNSLYELTLRQERGELFMMISHVFALEEFKKGLQAPYKDPWKHHRVLMQLLTCYEHLHDKQKTSSMTEALQLFWKRYHEKDPQLTTRGVNDFLTNEGVLR